MSKRIITLHDAQTQISGGNTIIVDDVDTLIIAISGSSTSFTLQFLASLLDDGENYFPLSGNKMSDLSTFATSTTAVNEAWQFDVTGLSYFKANLSAIGNGTVTVLAKAFR